MQCLSISERFRCMQSGTPAKSVASARVSSSVPKENVPANTGASARGAGALRPKAVAGDSTVADLTEQVHTTLYSHPSHTRPSMHASYTEEPHEAALLRVVDCFSIPVIGTIVAFL